MNSSFASARRILGRSLAACMVALLAACSVAPSPLIGVVFNDYTGEPIAGATVQLGSARADTDAAGKFEFAFWSESDTLQVAVAGYEPAAIALASQPEPASGQSGAVVNIALRPNTVAGVVRDTYTSEPIVGATVRSAEGLSATTDAEGRYAIAGVPTQFQLTIEAAGYEAVVAELDRATIVDADLRPNTLTGVITDQFTSAPIAGATISAGEASAVSDAEGKFSLVGLPEEVTVTVEADGYAPLSQSVNRATALNAALRPDLLRATLIDVATGAPIQNAAITVSPELGAAEVAFIRLSDSRDGQFTLEGVPERGVVQILAPGYRKAVVELTPDGIPPTIELVPFKTRSIYITSAVAANEKMRLAFFDMIDRTELNAIVIDLKSDLRDDLGLIYYDSQVPIVKELGTSAPYYDIKAIIAEAKRRNIYLIARVHMFSHDNVLADARPDWAARDRSTGGVFADYPTPTIRYTWLDPWNENVWDYNIQLSVEAARLGFDEINYDYIRFPSLEFSPTDKERLQLSREGTPEEKFQNIANVLERSHRAINGAGAFFSVDVFGYTVFEASELIGQDIAIMSQHTDYVCPMVYPSHFNPGDLGIPLPARDPGRVIEMSMKAGAEKVAGKNALLRPWLQDFTLVWVPDDQIVEYGAAEVRAQIDAVDNYPISGGWILYDSANTYTEGALQPATPGDGNP